MTIATPRVAATPPASARVPRRWVALTALGVVMVLVAAFAGGWLLVVTR